MRSYTQWRRLARQQLTTETTKEEKKILNGWGRKGAVRVNLPRLGGPALNVCVRACDSCGFGFGFRYVIPYRRTCHRFFFFFFCWICLVKKERCACDQTVKHACLHVDGHARCRDMTLIVRIDEIRRNESAFYGMHFADARAPVTCHWRKKNAKRAKRVPYTRDGTRRGSLLCLEAQPPPRCEYYNKIN